jgi:hypothetical protein
VRDCRVLDRVLFTPASEAGKKVWQLSLINSSLFPLDVYVLDYHQIHNRCAAKMQKNGEVGDRNLDLPQSARCKADALPLSYIPNYFQL